MAEGRPAASARWRENLHTLWQMSREAVSDTAREYTSGSIRRALFLLAIPMVLEMGMESVFVIVDMFFVSRLGSGAVAAVGLTEAMLTLLYAVAIGASMGATALVARRIGEGNIDAARATVGQVIWIGVGLSLVIGVLGIVFAPELLAFMGAEPDVIATGQRFTATMLGGSITILMIFLLNAVFRGAGNAVIAMRALWIANGINIVLDPCLIFGLGPFPELGVTGAAVATNIGRGIGVAYQVYCLCRGNATIRLRLSSLRLELSILLRLLRVSVPGAIQLAIAMSSYVILMRMVSIYGSDAVAGLTIGIRIFTFTFLPAFGLGNAAATLVGQNLGANRPDRAERSVWMAARWNASVLFVVAVLMGTVPEVLASPFTQDPIVTAYVVDCLRIVSLGYVFFAVGMILTQALSGAGDTDTPTLINLVCLWGIQLPLAYWLSRGLEWGPRGIFASISIADTLVALLAVAVFRWGRWKLRSV